MKIEVLYPQICNLYGDLFNIKYLESCSDRIQIFNTNLGDVPAFVSGDTDMIYIGSMTERAQSKVIETLLPYRERIIELINSGAVILATGNAIELFGSYIKSESGEKVEALGIFEVHSVRNIMKRHNSTFIGKLSGSDIDIVGFKSQFSMMYGDNSGVEFAKAYKGIGMNPESHLEGLRRNNFFATYLLGPLLVLNPLFTEYLLTLAGETDINLKYRQELMDAYQQRLAEFKRL